MKYLNIKLVRDIKNNWTQFFSVFLMAFLSVLLFVGLQGAWKGLDVSLHQYDHNSNLANYWVQATKVSQKNLKQIKTLSGVKQAASGVKIQASSGKHYLTITSLKQTITKPHLVRGQKFNKQANGIWLNKEYADKHKIRVGQKISLKYNGKKVKLTVKGIIQTADKVYFTGTSSYIAPNYAKYGYALAPLHYLQKKFPHLLVNNYVEISGHHYNMRKQIEKIFSKNLLTYNNRATLTEISTASERVTEIKNLSYLFSFIFVLLAILAMVTTIRRLVEDQIGEIAVLKALGFSNRIIGLHYGSFGLLIGGLGSLAGVICAPAISLFVLATQKTMFSLPHWQLAYTYSAVLVVLAIMAICIVSAYFAARTAMQGLPAEFLRGKQEKNVHHLWLERFSGIWAKLSYEARWLIRDAFFNKIRMLMGIVGVAGGMMLMIAGIGMPQSINHLVHKTYQQDYQYTQSLTINNYSVFKKMHPHQKGQWLQSSQAHFSKDDGYNHFLTILGKGKYVNLKTINGQKIKDGGLYVTRSFAKKAGIKQGDYVKVKAQGSNSKHNFKVKGILDSQINQGAYLTAATWKKAGGHYNPTTLLIGKKVSYPKNAVASVVTIVSQKKNATNFVNNLMNIFILIIAFAVVLIVVVLYNLGALGFVERYREYATLRVLGIHKKELRRLAFLENLATTLIGWLIGIPAGIWFLGKYVATFTTINVEYVPYVNWTTLILASLFVWACSMSTTLFLNQRIKKIDMVQALKGVE